MAKTIRQAYAEALTAFAKTDDRIVVLDADVSTSTRSAVFGEAYPDRFFNVGIAELNLVSMACGFAAAGKIPFANTFAVFISSTGLIAARAFASYSNLNVKLMGGYGGLSDARDGASHQSLEDVAIMRTLPNFQVFVAADETQTKWLVRNAIDTEGPMYIRLCREALPPLYDESTRFEAGKGIVLREGTDVTIIANGVEVAFALEAAKALEGKGVSARVVDMFCVKPIDKDLIMDSAARTKAIVTAEEHSVTGGLGGAVAEVLAGAGVPCVQEFVGVKDCHAESGAYEDLLHKYGLDSESIIAACERAVARK